MNQLFPRDRYGRIALGLASLCLGPVCWVLAFALVFGARPADVLDWLFLACVEEVMLALSWFFACGLIWAVATPRWLERRLESVARKLEIGLGIFAVPFLCLAAWALTVG